MKKVLFILTIACFTLFSCNNDELKTDEQNPTIEGQYFSKSDISKITQWITNQPAGKKLTTTNFPSLEFSVLPSSNSNAELVKFYQNGIMYLNDDILKGEDLNYDSIKQQIMNDDNLDKNDKAFLLSFCQLSDEIFTSDIVANITSSDAKVGCDCSASYNAYITVLIQCQAYGNVWGHCDAVSYYFDLWQSCLNKELTCPPGFTYDGANCYSAVHFPPGYTPFIWGNGFYVKPNCSISTANNCCPGGFGYDGANCHYWGLYFPSDYEAFIYGNSFYVKPKCL